MIVDYWVCVLLVLLPGGWLLIVVSLVVCGLLCGGCWLLVDVGRVLVLCVVGWLMIVCCV